MVIDLKIVHPSLIFFRNNIFLKHFLYGRFTFPKILCKKNNLRTICLFKNVIQFTYIVQNIFKIKYSTIKPTFYF